MKCSTLQLPGGGTAILCGSRRRPPPCIVCKGAGARQCDAPVETGGELVVVSLAGEKKRLCSRWLCRGCAQTFGELDFCPAHRRGADNPKTEVGAFDRGIDRSNPVVHEQRHGGDPTALFGSKTASHRYTTSSRTAGKVTHGVVYRQYSGLARCDDCGVMMNDNIPQGQHAPRHFGGRLVNCLGVPVS